MSPPKEIYSERVAGFQGEGRTITRDMTRISLLRLILGLSACVIFYFGFGNQLYFIAFGILIVVFVYFVNHHARLKENYSETRILIELNENELKNLSGENDTFDYDPSNNYSNHIYANDLDVFGTLSLFRHINRTATLTGKQMVIEHLLTPGVDVLTIHERKEVLSELCNAIDWRQRFYFIGTQSGEKPGDIPRIASWNAQPRFFANRKHWIVIATIVTLVTLGLILYMTLFGGINLLFLIFLFVFNTSIYQLFFRTSATMYFRHFGDFSRLFSTWSDLCTLISEKPLGSVLGKKVKAQVSGASRSFREIANVNKLIAYRSNGLMAFIINGACLFDVWFIFQIERWRKRCGHDMNQWIDSIHQVDFLNSFANYKFNHPAFCDAEISDGPNRISATLMGHPLIQPGRLVSNDFEIGVSSNAHIITGSNMSGKSTFLRAVGLNMVLALNGLPVCARTFSCSPLSIATCIRISDSLEENQSYFRAEIKKLSQIMKLLETGRPYLVLLDEILRGTNSTDKQTGTRLFYQRLATLNCVALLATHDPEIGNLANEAPDHFQNFNFESYIIDSEIHFDYLLRPGVSVTKNATLLMRQLNLIQ